MAAWAGQLVALNAIDPDARSLFTPWVLFVGHLMFGMVSAAWMALGRLPTTVTAASQPRIHAHA